MVLRQQKLEMPFVLGLDEHTEPARGDKNLILKNMYVDKAGRGRRRKFWVGKSYSAATYGPARAASGALVAGTALFGWQSKAVVLGRDNCANSPTLGADGGDGFFRPGSATGSGFQHVGNSVPGELSSQELGLVNVTHVDRAYDSTTGIECLVYCSASTGLAYWATRHVATGRWLRKDVAAGGIQQYFKVLIRDPSAGATPQFYIVGYATAVASDPLHVIVVSANEAATTVLDFDLGPHGDANGTTFTAFGGYTGALRSVFVAAVETASTTNDTIDVYKDPVIAAPVPLFQIVMPGVTSPDYMYWRIYHGLQLRGGLNPNIICLVYEREHKVGAIDDFSVVATTYNETTAAIVTTAVVVGPLAGPAAGGVAQRAIAATVCGDIAGAVRWPTTLAATSFGCTFLVTYGYAGFPPTYTYYSRTTATTCRVGIIASAGTLTLNVPTISLQDNTNVTIAGHAVLISGRAYFLGLTHDPVVDQGLTADVANAMATQRASLLGVTLSYNSGTYYVAYSRCAHMSGVAGAICTLWRNGENYIDWAERWPCLLQFDSTTRLTFPVAKLAYLNATTHVQNAQLVALDLAPTLPPQVVQGTLTTPTVLGGARVMQFSGHGHELGWTTGPQLYVSLSATAGSFASGSAYSFYAKQLWYDDLGDAHWSPLSKEFVYTPGTASRSADVDMDGCAGVNHSGILSGTLVTNPGNEKPGVAMVIAYMRAPSSAVHKRCLPLLGKQWYNSAALTINVTTSDELLDEDAQRLERVAPPPSNIVTRFGNRLALVNALDPEEVWISHEKLVGQSWSFSAEVTVRLAGQQVLSLCGWGDKLVIFGEKDVYILSGPGPSETGLGAFNPLITCQTGGITCTQRNSPCAVPQGVLFANDRMIYLLDSAGAVQPIGVVVEDTLKDRTILRAVNFAEAGQVRFLLGGTEHNDMLVYDYLHGVWSYWAMAAETASEDIIVDICNIDESMWLLTAGGRVMQEADTAALDIGDFIHTANTAYAVTCQCSTPWIKLDSIAGLQRLWRANIVSSELRYEYPDETFVTIGFTTWYSGKPTGWTAYGTDAPTLKQVDSGEDHTATGLGACNIYVPTALDAATVAFVTTRNLSSYLTVGRRYTWHLSVSYVAGSGITVRSSEMLQDAQLINAVGDYEIPVVVRQSAALGTLTFTALSAGEVTLDYMALVDEMTGQVVYTKTTPTVPNCVVEVYADHEETPAETFYIPGAYGPAAILPTHKDVIKTEHVLKRQQCTSARFVVTYAGIFDLQLIGLGLVYGQDPTKFGRDKKA